MTGHGPGRLAILVDQERSHALRKIGAPRAVGANRQFQLKALGKTERRGTMQLLHHDARSHGTPRFKGRDGVAEGLASTR